MSCKKSRYLKSIGFDYDYFSTSLVGYINHKRVSIKTNNPPYMTVYINGRLVGSKKYLHGIKRLINKQKFKETTH